MNRKYVILRRASARRFGMPRAGASSAAPAATLKIEVGELSPRRAATLALKRETQAVAPAMPMKLITPVGSAASASSATGEATWGVKAVAAHTSPFDGDGVTVAILDTGIDAAHPAFAGVELVRRNFTEDSDDDEDGHGTHCAGTTFGRAVNGTRIGVAPGVKRALIGKVLGEGGGGSDLISEAVFWALEGGANVISLSIGVDFPGFVRELEEEEDIPTEQAISMALEGYRANILLFDSLAKFAAARNAFRQAALLVAAAGNESQRGGTPDFVIAVSPPAVSDGFISVAAVGEAAGGHVVAPFSNYGARVSGPGVDIFSAGIGGGLRPDSGTSMATPHVAGVAALWGQKLAAGGELNGRLLTDRLVGSATTARMEPGFDPADVGAGMVQAPQE